MQVLIVFRFALEISLGPNESENVLKHSHLNSTVLVRCPLIAIRQREKGGWHAKKLLTKFLRHFSVPCHPYSLHFKLCRFSEFLFTVIATKKFLYLHKTQYTLIASLSPRSLSDKCSIRIFHHIIYGATKLPSCSYYVDPSIHKKTYRSI